MGNTDTNGDTLGPVICSQAGLIPMKAPLWALGRQTLGNVGMLRLGLAPERTGSVFQSG